MATVKIKGNDISYSLVKDSFQRRMIQFSNKIHEELKKVGVGFDYIDEIEHPKLAIVPKPAHIEWNMGQSSCCFTVNKEKKYVDNLNLLQLCLKKDVQEVLDGAMSLESFELKYAEDGDDVHDKRKEAREHLGLDHDVDDIAVINDAYKQLAKKHHPDMPEGCIDTFKKINAAHKVLKRELE